MQRNTQCEGNFSLHIEKSALFDTPMVDKEERVAFSTFLVVVVAIAIGSFIVLENTSH